MTLNSEHFQNFGRAYLDGLTQAHLTHPDDYGYKTEEVPIVCNRMLTKIASSPYGVNYDGQGLKNACKALGIKHTRKAIIEYLFTI